MLQEGRLEPADLAYAEESLRRFIDLIREDAERAGHPEWIGENNFDAAKQFLESMKFELWPFWPLPWMA